MRGAVRQFWVLLGCLLFVLLVAFGLIDAVQTGTTGVASLILALLLLQVLLIWWLVRQRDSDLASAAQEEEAWQRDVKERAHILTLCREICHSLGFEADQVLGIEKNEAEK